MGLPRESVTKALIRTRSLRTECWLTGREGGVCAIPIAVIVRARRPSRNADILGAPDPFAGFYLR